MRVKLDEDLPRAAVFLLRSAGEDVQTVHDQGMNGWQDPDLWRAVQTEERFLITGDKGFADLRSYPPGSHGGVLLLRPDRDGVGPLVDLLKMVLATVDLESLAGAIAVAAPSGLRIRRPGSPGSAP